MVCMTQVLVEDITRNRMLESISLFEGIVNMSWFRDVAVILFLNKDDLFQKKSKIIDLGMLL